MDKTTDYRASDARRGAGASAYEARSTRTDAAYSRAIPIGADRRGGGDYGERTRSGVYLEDGIILLGILAGGAAGYAAAAYMRSADRGPAYTHGPSRRDETARLMSRTSRRHRGEIVEDDETHDLIASDKVEGTAVYGRDGEKIGTVHNFMVGKRTGEVAYAVVSIGGFLGLGETRHALPWDELDYDEHKQGYRIRGTKDELKNAPRHGPTEDAFSRPDYGGQIRSYWSTRRDEHTSGMPTPGRYHA